MEAARSFVGLLYRHILQRQPGENELVTWSNHLLNGMTEREAFDRFIASVEYRKRFTGFNPAHPPGHYYSPIVDPRELVGPRKPNRDIDPADIPGIRLDLAEMRRWWLANARTLRSTPYPQHAEPRWRYYSDNNIYPIGDAAILRAKIVENRPARIIEIGSGFSTACMLDTIDEHGLKTNVVCIEPYAERLKSRLRAEDTARVTIIETAVQEVAVDMFKALLPGDILFIDSTHVLKTGSDVNYELFNILPVLAPGVVIHFHDMHYPFEYPDQWIYDRQYSWNEVYAVRAFLMYNSKFAVTFMNSLFHLKCQDLVEETLPRINENPGGSLWIRKVG